MKKVAVIGAGVVGLSTALSILKKCEKVCVTVLADKVLSETTSNGVPGLFRPAEQHIAGIPPALARRWLGDSWKRFDGLIQSTDAERAGVQMISGYQFTDSEETNNLERDLVHSYHTLDSRELSIFPHIRDKFSHGRFTTTATVEPAKYLKYLSESIIDSGGKIVKCNKIKNLEELYGLYDIVVNCTGTGSIELLNDKDLVPCRGYLIRMKALWIKHFVIVGSEALIYAIPGQEVLHVGGVRTDNDMEGRVRSDERTRILENIYKVLPSLKKAEIVSEFVGWRPLRKSVRVESEIMNFGSDRKLKVVHNYGHGGAGVMLSWGTAQHAAQLVKEFIVKSPSVSAKL